MPSAAEGGWDEGWVEEQGPQAVPGPEVPGRRQPVPTSAGSGFGPRARIRPRGPPWEG